MAINLSISLHTHRKAIQQLVARKGFREGETVNFFLLLVPRKEQEGLGASLSYHFLASLGTASLLGDYTPHLLAYLCTTKLAASSVASQ